MLEPNSSEKRQLLASESISRLIDSEPRPQEIIVNFLTDRIDQ